VSLFFAQYQSSDGKLDSAVNPSLIIDNLTAVVYWWCGYEPVALSMMAAWLWV